MKRPKLIFTESTLPLILEALKMSVDKNGFVITPDGQYVEASKIRGFQGSKVVVDITKTYKVDRYEFIVNGIPQPDGGYACHVPAYDLFFSAKDEESMDRKSIAIVKSFLDFYKIK